MLFAANLLGALKVKLRTGIVYKIWNKGPTLRSFTTQMKHW